MKKKYGFSKKKPKITSSLAVDTDLDNLLEISEDLYEEEFVEETIVDESKSKQESIFSKFFGREAEMISQKEEEMPRHGIEETYMEDYKNGYSKEENHPSTTCESTVISSGFIIRGDVESTDSLVLSGSIEGNVTSTSGIELQNGSSITGNVKSSSLKANGGHIQGNVTVDEQLVLDHQSIIIGAIQADGAHISGRIEGPISAKGAVVIASTAEVKGDLSAASIVVESGAQLSGSYTVTPSKKQNPLPVYEEVIEEASEIELN